MILQALHQLYLRTPSMPRRGFAPMGISWVVALNLEGEIVQIRDFRSKKERGSGLIPTDLTTPTVGKRTSGDKAIFLCDKSDYVIGRNSKAEETEEDRQKLTKRFELFAKLHRSASGVIKHPYYDALLKFLNKWEPFAEGSQSLLEEKSGTHLAELSGGNFAFMISGEPDSFLHDLPQCVKFWQSSLDSNPETPHGICLVTNEEAPIARLHPAIKGVIDPGGQAEKGIVAINKDKTAFTSYGKEQSFNAPVSEEAAFAYCTALNYLLASDSRRFRVGDTTTVFWTEKPTEVETLLPFMMDSTREEPEDATLKVRLQAVMEKIATGKLAGDDLGNANTRFYILGLAPNASRISIRFWHTSTLGDLAANLQKHHNDLSIVRQRDETNSKHPEPKVPGYKQLLRQTARDDDSIPPLLGGALVRSSLLGTDYPDSLFQKVMSRIRVAEKDRNGDPADRVPYLRAAILKAYLNRNHQKWLIQHQTTMNEALDKTIPHVAYQLGRLFSVYEKAQRAAHEYKLDRTIRETMFSAASATPLAVFGRLDRLHKHHLAKLSKGSSKFYSDLVEEIHQKIHSPQFYPAALSLREQGLFCIGYYHQRHDLRFKEAPSEESSKSLENASSTN